MTSKKLSTEAIYRMQHPNSRRVWEELSRLLGMSKHSLKYVHLANNEPNGRLTAVAAVECISHVCNINVEDVLVDVEETDSRR